MVKDIREIPLMVDPEGYVTPEQFRLMYSACEAVEEKILLRLLWFSGARISELLKLRKENFDFKGHTVTLPTLKRGKGRKSIRTISLEPITLKMVEEFTKDAPNDKSVLDFDRFKARRIVQNVGKRVGIERMGSDTTKYNRLHPHNFRHGFSICAVKRGVPINVIKEWLGHTSLRTTSFYLRFTDSETKEYMKRMWK